MKKSKEVFVTVQSARTRNSSTKGIAMYTWRGARVCEGRRESRQKALPTGTPGRRQSWALRLRRHAARAKAHILSPMAARNSEEARWQAQQ